MKDNHFSCVLSFDGYARELAIPVSIGCRCGDCKRCGLPERNCRAIFDTGATSSMISSDIAQELQLIPTGVANISGVHGTQETNLYVVNLIFQNGFVIPRITVSEAGPDGGFELLIGMDIISRGMLIITCINGKNLFLFSYPSICSTSCNV